ncbi:hypothetical protein [Candidatus Methylobacter favarea]|uniref:hypothetical protein n=1 Tax=Candidatus Methylobacter favarea TaxID=2707345 RepID=UPI001FE9D4FF|nr:hypothetical protein [Candidatus Methylobacter favarea]
MKKNNLINSLFAGLLLASPIAGAEQYPAADFQPKVIYQDETYQPSKSETADTTSEPSVSKSETASEADSQYPAAHFQPKVLYKDADYKPSQALTENPVAAAPSPASSGASQTTTEKAASSLSEFWPGLIILALAGLVYFKKQSKAKKVETKPSVSSGAAGQLTGVAKYLNRSSGTGVARYLEKHVKSGSGATGVAKYIAKTAGSARGSATGVEKYMRERG